MKDFLAFDTEDNSVSEVLAHGHSFNKRVTQIAALGMGSRFHNRGDTDKFKEWLTGFPDGTICYAHNLQYDLGNIFNRVIDELDVKMVGGRMIRARWKNIIFMDSFNIWPMALKTLGKAFGIEKMKFDADSEEYVFRDVEIVHAGMSFARKMAEDYGVESFPATLGSLCVKVWQEMGGEAWQCSDDMARDSLYGGRVELFSTGGQGKVYYVDVNSLYPAVMRYEFPTEMKTLSDIKGWGVAEVQIEVPPMTVAPLPLRQEDGRIFYPTGNLHGIWTFHEIRNAVAQGAKIYKVIRAEGSLTGVKYYEKFVTHFYAKRKTATNSAEKMMFKLLMNNRYGQLAMKGVVTQSVDLSDDDFGSEGLFKGEGIPYGKKKLADIAMPIPQHVNFLHASYVTSYGRLELQKYLRMIDPASLIYCDTDSIIFFHKDGNLPFPVSGELGEMKLEGTANRCYAIAPKMYLFGHHLKVKGVPKRMVYDGKRRYIPAVDMFRKGEAEYAMPFKFREAVRFYDEKKDKDGEVVRDFNSRPLSVWRKIKKKHKSDYDKKSIKDGIYSPKSISMFKKKKR